MKQEIASSAKRRKKLRAVNSRPYRNVYLLLTVAMLMYLSVYFGSLHYQNFILMENRLREVKTEQTLKKDRIKMLEHERAKLQDPEHLKTIAREKLYLMNPNEVHIKIIPNPAELNQEQQQPEPKKKATPDQGR